MKTFVVQIDWYGPYSRQQLSDAARRGGYWSAMYLARGRLAGSQADVLNYIGISFKNYPYRVKENHKKLDRIVDPKMYGGLVYYHNAPDLQRLMESAKYHDTLKYAEAILAYLLQPPMNDTDVFELPIENAVIVNRWFDGSDPDAMVRQSRGDPTVPDYIEYDPEQGAKFVWLDDQPRSEFVSRDQLQARARQKPNSN